MELVAPFSPGIDQPGRLEDVEVLRDSLACRREPVPCRQSDAQLEQGLAVSILELIEDGSSGRVGQGLEHVSHDTDDRQAFTCLSILPAVVR